MPRLAILTFLLVYSVKSRAQPLEIACAPSSPVAFVSETLKLNMWASAAPGQKLAYAWTVSAGVVQSAGADSFAWSFKSASNGPQTADGELRSGPNVLARCLVEVQVVASRTAPDGSGFLAPATKEESAGLYVYLLLTPDQAAAGLGQSAAAAWLALNPAMAELRRLLPPTQSISVQVPVTDAPASAAATAWLIDHYDFTRARAWLQKLSLNEKSGVFIVSTLRPILEAKPPYLIQDLSQASPGLASSWVQALLNQAAQQRSWSPEAQSGLADQLRSTLGVLAPALPPSLFLKWIRIL